MSTEAHHKFPVMEPDHHLSVHQYSGWPEEHPQHISVRQYPSTSSALSSSAHPDEDWTKVSDLAERRRIQNRIAQRNYRKKIKERMAYLEESAGGDTSSRTDRAKAKTNEQRTQGMCSNSDYDRTIDAGDEANRDETVEPRRAGKLNDESEEDRFPYPVEPLSMSSEPVSNTFLTEAFSQVHSQDEPRRAGKLNDESEEDRFPYPVEPLSMSSEPDSNTFLTKAFSQVHSQDEVLTTSNKPIGINEDPIPELSTGNRAINDMRRHSESGIPNNVIALRLAEPATGVEEVSGPKRVQKHPATFQCSLCPKRFTRAYNLRSHLRTHTDERPFACTFCGKGFARQHDRKRHESIHSGEKKIVCKGDLKDGGQWGCGRRFARVEAFGRHLQSEAGRICVKPFLDEDFKTRRAKQPFSIQPATVGLRLPSALLFQYPALANIDWEGRDYEAGFSKDRSRLDSSDYESDDAGYVSGTETGFGESHDGFQTGSSRDKRGSVDNKPVVRLDPSEKLDDKLPRADSQSFAYTPHDQPSAADTGTADDRHQSPGKGTLHPELNRDQSQLHSRQSKGTNVDDAEVSLQENTDYQQSDDNMSLRSFTGSVFDMASIVSSASSLPSKSHTMVASFVDMLLRDPSMDRLLAITTSEFGVTSGRFTRNFSRILKSYSRHLHQSIERGLQDDREQCLIAAKSVSSARHQVSNLIASRYNERALNERDFRHREVELISRHLDQPVSDGNDEPSSNEESSGDELDFRIGDLEQFLLSGQPFRLLKRNLRSLVIPDEFLHCIDESSREFLNLIFTDRRPRSFARGLLNALANGRDIRFDFDTQLRFMAADLKAECTEISQLDAAVFLETYSHYISAVAIDEVKDVFTPLSQATRGTTQSEKKSEISHGDLLEQVVADSLPSVLYVDLEPHRTFLASSSAFASFIDALRGLVYPTFFTEATRSVKATIRSAETSENTLVASEGQSLLVILSEMQSCFQQRNIPIHFNMKPSESHLKALNRIKLAIEASTASQWDWWPLQPPSRPGSHDRAELSWQCSCGIQRNELILPRYASELQRIFNSFPLSTGGSNDPVDRSTRSLSNASSQGGRSTHSADSSSIGSSGVQSASSSSSSANTAITPPDSVVDFGTGPRRYIYVFLLTKASEYKLDTIDLSSMEARDFFQALRTIYNKHRGFWRRAFSVFVYNHCDFIKIIKPEPDTFMPGELKFELPADHDDEYHYRPRPTYSAPVTKHMFRHYFYGCYDSSALSHRLHTCLPLSPTCRIRSPAAELLEYLPKRDRKVAAAAQSDKVEVCYGLAAREFRSFFRVVVYLCLVMAPAFWFIFAWLFAWGDRGDLQDATVPMTLTMAVLSILWAVIYSGSDVRKDYGDE